MGFSNIVIGLTALVGSIFQGNYYLEETVDLQAGVTKISTPAAWETVTFFSPDKKTALPEIFVKNSKNEFVAWSTDKTEANSNQETDHAAHESEWVLTPKVFEESQTEIELYTKTPVVLTGHFFNTQRPFGRLVAAINTPKLNIGNFLFGDALLDGVEVTDFKNETEIGGFAGNFKPKFITRSGWGANETMRRWTWKSGISAWFRSAPPEAKYVKAAWKPVITTRKDAAGKKLTWPIEENQIIKKIVLHHTGEYLDDRHQMRKDPKKHVRSIYAYHTVTRGWGDIGYNFLIDKKGNIYEGRAGGPKTVGAHVDNYNVGTIGIAMIGNFNVEQPTQEQIKVLSIFLAYLTDKYEIPVNGKQDFLKIFSDNITAHRFVTRAGHGTSCAGENLVKLLPAIRNKVSEIQTLLKKLRAQGKLSGRDFLGLAPEAQKFRASKQFKLPEKKALITPATIWDKKVIAGKNKTTIKLKVTNNSKFTWKKGAKLSVKSAPGGLEISDFVVASPIFVNGQGFITGTIAVTSLQSGSYSIELSPDFLREKYFKSQYANARLVFPIKVVGNFSALISQLSANSFQANVPKKNNSFQLPSFAKTSASTTSPASKPVRNNVVKSSVSAGVTRISRPEIKTKIKIAGFDASVAKVVSDKNFEVILAGKNIGQVYAGQELFLSMEDDRVAFSLNGKKVSGRYVLLKNNVAGVFEIKNYSNPRFGGGKVSYNKFRQDLFFEPNTDTNRLTMVNELSIEKYLWGLGEEPSAEPEQKKHAIYTLARSYAVVYSKYRRKFGTQTYDLEDDPRTSQLYLGYDWEVRHPEQKSLVAKTKGRVLTYENRPVIGPYFTQSGGESSSKWSKQYPWTRAQKLPFDEGLPAKGHGVGLSGNSARQLAKLGYNYKQILEYFFDDVSLKKIY